ncbi:hypothetical protein ACF1A9_38270 [Streptomyces sp. NPDC014872]|uniref:hypothetical protein n=1 Tax=unclassified Streptomyces TaxID=2593676 RepID=UPI0037020777
MAQETEKVLAADGYLHNGKWNAAVGDAANHFAGQVDCIADRRGNRAGRDRAGRPLPAPPPAPAEEERVGTGADEVVLAWETCGVATACELPVVGPVPCPNTAPAGRNSLTGSRSGYPLWLDQAGVWTYQSTIIRITKGAS